MVFWFSFSFCLQLGKQTNESNILIPKRRGQIQTMSKFHLDHFIFLLNPNKAFPAEQTAKSVQEF